MLAHLHAAGFCLGMLAAFLSEFNLANFLIDQIYYYYYYFNWSLRANNMEDTNATASAKNIDGKH